MSLDKMWSRAVEIGERNKVVIDRANAWCRHIRQERGMMGVGEVERQTGLPVSGGTFRCEYAAKGAMFQGMDLEPLALDFYRDNCRECKYREPTGILDHLGKWAEEQIQIADAAEISVKEEKKRRVESMAARSERRRLTLRTLDAERQSLLDLIDRVDSEDTDEGAGESLLHLASMHPEAFSPELINALVRDVKDSGNGVLLQTVLVLSDLSGSMSEKEVVGLALWALNSGVAVSQSAAWLSDHVRKEDFAGNKDAVLLSLSLAGPHSYGLTFGDLKHEPELFIRFLEEDADYACGILEAELVQGNPLRRERAAKSAEYALRTVPDRSEDLIRMLLDSLKYEDVYEYSGDPSPTASAVRVVAGHLLLEPRLVEHAIGERWNLASDEYRQRLLSIYDRAVRHRLGESIPDEALEIIMSRCLESILLKENPRTMVEACNLLDLVCNYHGLTINVDTDKLFGALYAVIDQIETPTPKAKTPLELIQQYGELQSLRVCAAKVVSAIARLKEQGVKEFWEYLLQLWQGAPSDSGFRSYISEIAAKSCTTATDLTYALPILYTAMFGSSAFLKIKAIRSLHQLARQGIPMPDEVYEGFLVALFDARLDVAVAAARTIPYVPFEVHRKSEICLRLIEIAFDTASNGSGNDTGDVIAVLTCISENKPYSKHINEACLQVINTLPSYYGSRILVRSMCLATAPSWISAVLKMLAPSADPNDSLDHNDKDRLILILTQYPELVLANADAFADLGRKLAPVNRVRAWQVCDLLFEVGALDQAIMIAESVVDSLPDTIENRASRLYSQQVLECFRFEKAVVNRDVDSRNKAASSWKKHFESDSESNHEE